MSTSRLDTLRALWRLPPSASLHAALAAAVPTRAAGGGGGGGAAAAAPPAGSLLWRLARLSAPQLATAAGLYALEVGATLCTPVAINALLSWAEATAAAAAAGGGGGVSASGGAAAVAALACASAVSFAAAAGSERAARAAGGASRMAALAALYAVVVRTPAAALARARRSGSAAGGGGDGSGDGGGDGGGAGDGELLSLLGGDADALAEVWHGLIGLFLQPLEIAGCLGLLAWTVGASAAGGVAVVVASLAISNICGAAVARLDAARGAQAELRLRDLFEMLLGARVVKLAAWEPLFAAAVLARRAAESALARQAGCYLATINTISSNSVDLISLAVILLYTLAFGNTITPAVVFTYWVVLGLLHARIFHYPVFLKHAREGLAAARRIDAFLSAPRAPDARAPLAPPAEGAPAAALIMRGAACAWRATSAGDGGALLTRVDLRVARGELVALVGRVGAGKTTLLSALLGEAAVVAGTCELEAAALAPGGLAFAPQGAWILAGSVRANILLGRDFDAARYAAVVDACALRHDFAQWPLGDATRVTAASVSGGQRQRISLARAAYGRSALYLFDDVLSALDQRVARAVVDGCLAGGGLLAGATRVVATNHPLLIAAADRIALLLPVAAADGPHTLVVGTLAELAADAAAGPILAQLMHAAVGSVDDALDGGAAAAEAPLASPPPLHPPLPTDDDADAGGEGGEDASIDGGAAFAASSAESDKLAAGHGRARLPFLIDWQLGAGGLYFAAGVLILLFFEAAAVEVGVYWLSLWSEDAGYARFSQALYAALYAGFIAVELAAAYARQHVYVAGTVRAADALHRAVLFRLTHAPVRYFDTHSAGALLQLFTRDMAAIDSKTFYASEYFFVGTVYTALIVLSQFAVTVWVLVPAALTAAAIGAGVAGHARGARARASAAAALRRWLRVAPALADVGAASPPPPRRLPCVGTDVEQLRVGLKAAPAAVAAEAAAPPPPSPTPPPPRLAAALARLSDVNAAEFEASLKARLSQHVAASLEGLTSIRAFAAQGTFEARLGALLGEHAEALLAVAAAKGARVLQGNMAGCLYYVLSAAMVVPLVAGGSITAGAAGFVIVNACFSSSMVNLVIEHASELLALGHARSRLLRMLAETPQEELWEGAHGGADADDAAVQRAWGVPSDAAASRGIDAAFGPYCARLQRREAAAAAAAPPPPPPGIGGGSPFPLAAVRVVAEHAPPPAAWPAAGRLELRGLRLRYASGLPLVLRGIDVDIPGGCHVGLVGRTGSGKSSVLAALLRVAEAEPGGALRVDGLDVRDLPLHALRSRVGIVSQDPLFFSGSLRRNLDPFGARTDTELLAALDAVGLADFAPIDAGAHAGGAHGAQHVAAAAAAASPLDAHVAERGGNLSAGEQQLLAAARALLRRPHVLLCDEASASLDVAAEARLLRALRSAFAGATVVQIAHRLVSVVSCHLVIVLADGLVEEAGAPHELLADTDAAATACDAAGAGGATFRRTGAFKAMVGALAVGEQARLGAVAEATYAAELGWMRANMPHYLRDGGPAHVKASAAGAW